MALVGSEYYFTRFVSWIQGRVMTLSHGHISKVKVRTHTREISVRVFTLYCFVGSNNPYLDYISHNCCLLPEGVSSPWPKVKSSRSMSQSTEMEKLVSRPYIFIRNLICMMLHKWLEIFSLEILLYLILIGLAGFIVLYFELTCLCIQLVYHRLKIL